MTDFFSYLCPSVPGIKSKETKTKKQQQKNVKQSILQGEAKNEKRNTDCRTSAAGDERVLFANQVLFFFTIRCARCE